MHAINKNKKLRKALQLFILIFIVTISYTYKEKAQAQTFYGTNRNSYWQGIGTGGELNSNAFTGGCTTGYKRLFAYHNSAWEYVGNTQPNCSGSNFILFGWPSFDATAFSAIGYDGTWAIFYDVSNTDPSTATNYQSFTLNSGTVTLDGGTTNTNTHFTSISVSTSTQKLNVKGYWQATSTILVTQSTENETRALKLYPEFFGGSGFTNSTSTGNFDLNFRISQQGCLTDDPSSPFCTTDQNYTYQAVLYDGSYPQQQYPYKDATTTQLLYPYSGTSTIMSQDFKDQFYVATYGTSTIMSATQMLSFLNVPKLLQTKVPFAYIFQITSGIFEGINSTTSNSIPSGNFVWKNTIGGTSTIDMFSPTTIKTYLNDTIIGLWRAFLLVVLTIDFGYAIYNRVKAHKII